MERKKRRRSDAGMGTFPFPSDQCGRAEERAEPDIRSSRDENEREREDAASKYEGCTGLDLRLRDCRLQFSAIGGYRARHQPTDVPHFGGWPGVAEMVG